GLVDLPEFRRHVARGGISGRLGRRRLPVLDQLVEERLVDRRVWPFTHALSDRLQGLDRPGQLGGDLSGYASRTFTDRGASRPEGRSGEHWLPLDRRLLAGKSPRSRDPPR